MKKILLFVGLLLFLIPAHQARAQPGGLLDGKPLTVWDKSNTSTTTAATDSNESTYYAIKYSGGYVQYIFPTAVDMTGYYIQLQSTGGTDSTLTFYNSAGTVLSSIKPPFTPPNAAGTHNLSLKGVTRFRLTNSAGFNINLREFDIFGTLNLERPINVKVTPDTRSLKVSWTAPAGAVSYNIYVNDVLTENVESTSYTLQGLAPDVNKSVRVSAVYSTGESTPSDPITVAPYGDPLVIPLTAKAVYGGINLSWEKPVSYDSLSVSVYKDSKVLKADLTVQQTYKDTAVTPKASYVYYISYKDKYGRQSQSDPVTVTAIDLPDPELPAVSVGFKNWNSITINYSAPSSGKNFKIYRGTVQLERESGSGSYTYTNLSPDTEYNFHMTYTDQYGRDLQSETITGRTDVRPLDTTPPDQPLGLGATVTTDRTAINVFWTANKEDDLAGYNLYVKEDGTYRLLNVNKLLTSTGYTFRNPVVGSAYEFKLEAVDTSGNVSEPALKSVKVDPVPSTDSNQSGTSEYLLVTWTETEGAIGYNIYLNNRLVGQVGPNPPYEFKITRDMGYMPGALSNKASVKARFADGTEGNSGNSGGGGGAGDINLGAVIGVGPALETAIGFLGMYKLWILLVLGVIFAPVLYQLLLKLMNYLEKKNKVKGM